MNSTREHLRNLAAAFLEPGIEPAVRASRARTLAEDRSDILEGVRIASGIAPGRVLSKLKGEDGLVSMLTELDQTRAVAQQTLANTPGLDPRNFDPGTRHTGIGDGLPLIRGYADDHSRIQTHGKALVVPGIVSGDTIGVIDPALPLADSGTWTIDDVGEDQTWHRSVMVASVAQQVRDFMKDEYAGILDQLFLDVADRGAEVDIATKLIAAAGGTRDTAGDTATAIDQAEGLASAALFAPADIFLVNPVDWPAARRTVAESWGLGPAPTTAVSMGVTPGTMLVTGRDAFHLFRDDYTMHGGTISLPSILNTMTGIERPYYLAIRNPDAIQKVVITA